MENFELETQRLKLKPVTSKEREQVRSAIFAYPDVVKTLMGDASTPEKQEYLLDVWYGEYSDTWTESGFGLWGIYKNHGDLEDLPNGLLGIIWLEDTSTDSLKICDIGYALTPSAWGKGIVSEAAEAVVSYAFQSIEVDAVDALIFGAINPGSIRVIEKLGAQYIGQKPFVDYGGKEWFEMCHGFDLWLIETAQPGMSIDRIRSACFRTGQFVGEDFLSRDQAEQEILRSIALNNGLEMNADLQSLIVGTLNDGMQNAGWSHYRIERA